MKKMILLALLSCVLASAQAESDLDSALYLHNKKDYAPAFKIFMELADQGNPVAQANVGYYYDNGFAVSKDEQEAVRWYRMAAENGDLHAQYNLGVMYENGDGVPRDYGESFKWFTMAAEQGDRMAAVYIGLFYEEGLGRVADKLKAYAWYYVASKRHDSYGAQKRDELGKALDEAQLQDATAQGEQLLLELGDKAENEVEI